MLLSVNKLPYNENCENIRFVENLKMKLQHGLVNVLINGNFEEDAGTCSVVNDAFQENVSWALLRTFWDNGKSEE